MNESYMCCWIYYYYLIFFSTESIILFLAAGNNTGDDPLDVIKSENEARNNTVTILTYSFGQGRLLIQKGWKNVLLSIQTLTLTLITKDKLSFTLLLGMSSYWKDGLRNMSKQVKNDRKFGHIVVLVFPQSLYPSFNLGWEP